MPKKIKKRIHKAIDKMVENGGNIGKALKDAGYSDAYAKNPQKVVKTKQFSELVEDYFGDDFLMGKHKELFDHVSLQYFVFSKKMEDEEITQHMAQNGLTVVNIRESDKGKFAYYTIVDKEARKSAVDMAYKLKGSYAPIKQDAKVEIVDGLTEEEKIKLKNLIK